MTALDDTKTLYRLDSMNIFDALWKLPEYCQDAWQQAEKVRPPENDSISNIIVTGMGGAAAAGELLQDYCSSRISVPVMVVRDYVIPEFVGPNTLVFVGGCSGNTEETLSAYDEARTKKASLVTIAPEGKLKYRALGDGVPLITIPKDISLKVTTGYLLLPMLAVLQRLGFSGELSGEIADLVSHLKIIREKLKPELPEAENQAKQLAGKLYNRIPVIWGASGTTEAIARRWKGQINSLAKAPAYWNVLPELNHNEIESFQSAGELSQKLYVIILRDPYDHPRVQRRMEITKALIKHAVGGIDEVYTSGSTTLARIYTLLYTGDYTGAYLAVLYGMNPGSVKVTYLLQSELAK